MRYGFPFILRSALFAAPLLLVCCGGTKPSAITYPMGEKVHLGRLTYSVFESQWLTQLGEGPTPRIPQNRFFLVRASVVNGGVSDAIVPAFTLEGKNGETYSELQNGEGVPQWIGLLRSVKPADSAQGNVVFDVPPGEYKLRVENEDSSEHAYIRIPLSFNSESPEIPAPAPKR